MMFVEFWEVIVELLSGTIRWNDCTDQDDCTDHIVLCLRVSKLGLKYGLIPPQINGKLI
jgi:hypothetical protein